MGTLSAARAAEHGPLLLARLSAMSAVSYRGTVLVLWVLAAGNALACRGLFWDGASFLASILESGTFHDFYPARAHVAWLTQAPVLLLAKIGVRDVHLLAMVYSATLFAVPAALYHLALARVRDRGALLAAMIAVVAAVYLPTSFFIVGEYNIAYAAVAATFAVALTRRPAEQRDSALMLALGLVCIASYEAMLYLGPLTAAVILWSMRGHRDPLARVLAVAAALGFLGAAVVSAATTVAYWNHDHFVLVRAAAFDFWQNLQFVVPLAGLAAMGLAALAFSRWLTGRGPIVAACVVGAVLISTLCFRQIFDPEAMVFPPAHYVARSAAGGLLAALLVASWVHVAWPQARLPLLAVLHKPAAPPRLAMAMFILVIAGAVPDVALTRLWIDHLAWFRGMLSGQKGEIVADSAWMRQWPYRLFAQEWTYPALSVLLHSAPGQAVVAARNDYVSNRPFDPACGTVPRLEGYRWR
jgi:hypothetical protein